MDKQDLKEKCLREIERYQDKIIALGNEVYRTPELGYKEFKTGKRMEAAFRDMGLEPESGIAFTGCRVSLGKEAGGPKVAVMGELDCVQCTAHPDAAADGLVHACGHHVQLANLYGAALGIFKSGVMKYLGGSVDFIAVPAEECVDYEYRNRLMKEGRIHCLGGKQELMFKGSLDDTDLALQCHMMNLEPGKRCILNTKGNGFVSKTVHFLGKAAHAGFAPEQGINALNMAELAMNNIQALRETFRDEDKVRVSMVIKEGGGLVNVVPDRVTMEIMVRAFTIEAIERASHQISRAVKAAAFALGGQVEIVESMGYLPLNTSLELGQIYKENMMRYEQAQETEFVETWETAGSTDLGDLSQLMPCLHIWAEGIKGGLHTEQYYLADPYKAYIVPARMLALTVIDLLWDGGALGKEIAENFHPSIAREDYIKRLKDYQRVDFFDASDL